MYVNVLGRIVAEEWRRSETIRDRVHLDAFIVMPNHLHGIVVFFDPEVEAPTCPRNYRGFGPWAEDSGDTPDGVRKSTDPSHSTKASHGGATLGQPESDDGDPELSRPPRSLGSFIAGFKSAATTLVNDHRDTPGAAVWQRNYHDRIIRTERHWRNARDYIRRNPADWGGDRMNRNRDPDT